jgi:hypothetical protein
MQFLIKLLLQYSNSPVTPKLCVAKNIFILISQFKSLFGTKGFFFNIFSYNVFSRTQCVNQREIQKWLV